MDLFHPHRTSETQRWCPGTKYRGTQIVAGHWAEMTGLNEHRRWVGSAPNGNICPDCRNAYRNARYANEPMVREQIRRWQKDHPERRREILQKYYYEGGGKDTARRGVLARRARKANAVCEHGVGCFYQAAKVLPQLCLVEGCNRKDIQGDHWMPFVLGGLDCRENCQPLCKRHNVGKGDSHPDEWIRKFNIKLRT